MENKNWTDVREEVKRMNLSDEEMWKKHSIYRIPTWCADLNPKAYKPQMISFGPIHHGEAHLKPMEEHKRRALVHFIDIYMDALAKVVQQLDSYEQLDLMILDGCFMLEMLYTVHGMTDNYAFSDPIFSYHGMPFIRRDIMMIENQIPLLVLEKLIAVEKGEDNNEEFIHKLILKFCTSNAKPMKMDLGLHVLDVVRKSMLQIRHPRPSSSTPPTPALFYYSSSFFFFFFRNHIELGLGPATPLHDRKLVGEEGAAPMVNQNPMDLS